MLFSWASVARKSCSKISKTSHSNRLFFSFSEFSPFHSPNSGYEPGDPHTYHERKILPYSCSQLYNIVSDVKSYPRFVPYCTDARILSATQAQERSDNPVELDAELTVGFLTFQEKYISRVVCKKNESVEAIASSNTPLFRSLTTLWSFQPASPQSPHLTSRELDVPPGACGEDSRPTLVTLDLTYAFANPVHMAVSKAFFGTVSGMMVEAFEKRCLEVYGPGDK